MDDKKEAAKKFQAATEAKDAILCQEITRPMASREAYEAFKRRYPQEWENAKPPPQRPTPPPPAPDAQSLLTSIEHILWYLIGLCGFLATISMRSVPLKANDPHQNPTALLEDEWSRRQ